MTKFSPIVDDFSIKLIAFFAKNAYLCNMQKTLFALLVFIALLPLAGAADCAAIAVERWALLVGISQYPHGEQLTDEDWGEIHGANDVELLKETLIQQGFPPSHILTLTNAEAKAEAIRQSLRDLTFNLRI